MAEILNEWTYRQARSRLRGVGSLCRVAELAASVAGYEALRAGGGLSLELSSLDDFGRALVKGRIARGWTQTQLAQALGMPKQQVQRYEATEYTSASLSRMTRVAAALDLSFTGTAASRPVAERSSGLVRLRAGLAAAEVVQAAEKRLRLRRLTAAVARTIYDDLCETYYRLAPLHRTQAETGLDGIAHRLAVRSAIKALAGRRRGRIQ
jgi:transcriptional regulator with XRE-family HTH domain